MRLNKLIDLLEKVEQRHPGKWIEVEVFDEAGTRTSGFDVQTDYIFGSQRVTVMLTPSIDEPESVSVEQR